ncbi:DUF2062 domain-containing protein [Magnetovibrio blakemorei]|uniref:DUF2062 domain-containing protein n=1 Tax=Magnetovibrio blakemorei TaxID=28181 RepID=A0A1E5QBM0_9PROT|nr:DUF2062 domain-containing protein [Magnetovibrio blakemorei]OEJ69420.1 hypothetical protein BEN30_03165 [Magnetovibrio blakemorei]
MFLRRQKLSVLSRVRQFFWPSAGWHRSTRYVFHRVARIPGSAYSLAAGFACGAAISFTPFIGLHFILSALLALLLRANVLASAIGTAVGNPWTFPFIWIGVFNVGSWIMRIDDADAKHVDFLDVLTESMQAFHRLDFEFLAETSGPILVPMLVGAVPVSILVWILFYVTLRPMISKYQAIRHHRRTRKHIKIPPVTQDKS